MNVVSRLRVVTAPLGEREPTLSISVQEVVISGTGIELDTSSTFQCH